MQSSIKNSLELQMLTDTLEVMEFYKNWNNTRGDSGFDLFCVNDQVIPAKGLGIPIQFGIRCSLLKQGKPSGYLLLPRSSISNGPLRMSNSMGLVDSAYTGYITAKVDNLSDTDYTINKGERYFQLLFPNLQPLDKVTFVESLSQTQRGNGGFGSTGK
jgi:dUTP pyrophosphatase